MFVNIYLHSDQKYLTQRNFAGTLFRSFYFQYCSTASSMPAHFAKIPITLREYGAGYAKSLQVNQCAMRARLHATTHTERAQGLTYIWCPCVYIFHICKCCTIIYIMCLPFERNSVRRRRGQSATQRNAAAEALILYLVTECAHS